MKRLSCANRMARYPEILADNSFSINEYYLEYSSNISYTILELSVFGQQIITSLRLKKNE